MDGLHGIATIKRNGTNIIADVDAKLKVGGETNEVKMVGRKAHKSTRILASELELRIPHTSNVNLLTEQALSGVEIQFQSDNGAVYIIADAAQTGELDTGDEGLVTLTYMGDPATKL